MTTIADALLKAGLVTPAKAETEDDAKRMRAEMARLQYNADAKARVAAMDAAIKRRKPRNAPNVMRPRGIDYTSAATIDATGSDAGKSYRTSGPALPFGFTGRKTPTQDTRRPMNQKRAQWEKAVASYETVDHGADGYYATEQIQTPHGKFAITRSYKNSK